ncbi:hypothetical protein SESBI_03828 [Sesbania bispinosa]|nr:hypothetical protein SESBI_03828 [Sesbania bispinosa]
MAGNGAAAGGSPRWRARRGKKKKDLASAPTYPSPKPSSSWVAFLVVLVPPQAQGSKQPSVSLVQDYPKTSLSPALQLEDNKSEEQALSKPSQSKSTSSEDSSVTSTGSYPPNHRCFQCAI